jgi:predicted RNase H-like nuclease (RuvC/YqgF family)
VGDDRRLDREDPVIVDMLQRVSRLEERTSSLEKEIGWLKEAIKDLKASIDRLETRIDSRLRSMDSRLWWLVGTVVLTLVLLGLQLVLR